MASIRLKRSTWLKMAVASALASACLWHFQTTDPRIERWQSIDAGMSFSEVTIANRHIIEVSMLQNHNVVVWELGARGEFGVKAGFVQFDKDQRVVFKFQGELIETGNRYERMFWSVCPEWLMKKPKKPTFGEVANGNTTP